MAGGDEGFAYGYCNNSSESSAYWQCVINALRSSGKRGSSNDDVSGIIGFAKGFGSCGGVPKIGKLKTDSMVFNTEDEIVQGLMDQGVWEIKKAFSSMVTERELRVKIIKIIKLKNRTYETEERGEKVIKHYIDDIVVIGDDTEAKYYARLSDVIFN